MKDALKQDLLHSFFCFKKASISFSRYLLNAENGGISTIELSALSCIGGCGAEDGGKADQTTHHALHEVLAVSNAAVSQMLGSLEKRGYIQRET
ncbi:MAG: hypothetical protein LBP42_06870, partial [Treponema sp.]|nr:hypothetical protein [Treponema sp.]